MQLRSGQRVEWFLLFAERDSPWHRGSSAAALSLKTRPSLLQAASARAPPHSRLTKNTGKSVFVFLLHPPKQPGEFAREPRAYPKRTAVLLQPRTGHVARAGSPTVAKKVPLRLSALIAVRSAERSGTDWGTSSPPPPNPSPFKDLYFAHFVLQQTTGTNRSSPSVDNVSLAVRRYACSSLIHTGIIGAGFIYLFLIIILVIHPTICTCVAAGGGPSLDAGDALLDTFALSLISRSSDTRSSGEPRGASRRVQSGAAGCWDRRRSAVLPLSAVPGVAFF